MNRDSEEVTDVTLTPTATSPNSLKLSERLEALEFVAQAARQFVKANIACRRMGRGHAGTCEACDTALEILADALQEEETTR